MILLVALLPGCQLSYQEAEPPEPMECPAVEPVECPVCSVEAICPAPEIIERIVRVNDPVAISRSDMDQETVLQIIGAVEWALVEPANLKMEARIDTGAETTSIHAEEIQLIEIDQQPHVRFLLEDPESGETVLQELPLVRESRIRRQGDEPELRYVVHMWLSLGTAREMIEVNLTDRDDFEYPLLIGRNMLIDMAIVDVSRHHTLP